MRHAPIDPKLFVENRERLKKLLLPGALAIFNANDVPPTNADGTSRFVQNSDLFYLTGVDQEETVLVLFPDAADEKHREVLFVRETNEEIAIWEGARLTKERARKASGVQRVRWVSEFPRLFRQLMSECKQVWLNSNEHARATIEAESRDARFVRQVQGQFPLHEYRRLAPVMRELRAVKSEIEIALIRAACALTERGFRRVLGFVQPGVNETEIEAEFTHEFIRGGGDFAFQPIVASGANACVLHYLQNDQPCKKGDLLLLDAGANLAKYQCDLTRTIPVSGRFSRRQKQVYNAVRRVLRGAMKAATPGKLPKEWQRESQELMEKELVELGLLKTSEIKKQDPELPAVKKYFMHGIGHPLGLDTHDVADTNQPMRAGWVTTIEPGIYIREEGLGVRLENNVLITENGAVDLTESIPIEADEIEALMKSGPR